MMYPSKIELTDKLSITFDNKDSFVVLKDNLVYWVGGYFPLVIPKGFSSDGDSNPLKIFNTGKVDYDLFVATLVHDYGYRTKFLPRIFWDALLYAILKDTKGLFIASIYYVAVRVFGWIAWRRNIPEKYPKVKELVYKLICNQYEKKN